MAIHVICSQYPKCDGPGVAEYGDDFCPPAVEEHYCGYCSTESPVPMREATKEEVKAYQKERGE